MKIKLNKKILNKKSPSFVVKMMEICESMMEIKKHYELINSFMVST